MPAYFAGAIQRSLLTLTRGIVCLLLLISMAKPNKGKHTVDIFSFVKCTLLRHLESVDVFSATAYWYFFILLWHIFSQHSTIYSEDTKTLEQINCNFMSISFFSLLSSYGLHDYVSGVCLHSELTLFPFHYVIKQPSRWIH